MEEEKAPQIENPGKISIPDFKEYEIDRKGNVFRNGKLIKQQTNTYGYKHIHLSIGLSKSGENCPFYGKRGKCCLHSKPLFQFKNGELICYFDSIDEACKKYGYSHSLITRCCQHKVSIAYGYEWEYAFDYFIELTKQLRHNQRRYFAQRRPEILETCKKLESEVDAVIAKMFDKQLKMF